MSGSVELLAWFARRGRHDLPWRQTRDPWAVLVAEVMLQQTQVSRVIPRYHRFLARFPTVEACAGATAGEVIEEWHGLGYNRRALNLWRAAQSIATRFDGHLPRALGELLALPGVGAYTARAVSAFAFEDHVGVLDTNVARVLARTEGRPLNRAEAQHLADQALPAGQAWVWNQALMDLGSLQCQSREPHCGSCPVRSWCAWSLTRTERPDLPRGSGDPASTARQEGQSQGDPARGSAGVGGGQSRFAGSDRQGRGKLVAALRSGPVSATELARVMGWPDDPERALRVALTVLTDGLARVVEGAYRLP